MADKQTTKKTEGKQSEILRDVKDSAHKVWLAGLGAVAVAEEKGSEFFKGLVERGEGFEKRSKEQVEKIVDKVQGGVEDVREEAESLWGKLSASFDDKVAKAIDKLGVPTRDEIQKLTKRVEELTGKIDELKPKPASRSTTRKTTAKKGSGKAA